MSLENCSCSEGLKRAWELRNIVKHLCQFCHHDIECGLNGGFAFPADVKAETSGNFIWWWFAFVDSMALFACYPNESTKLLKFNNFEWNWKEEKKLKHTSQFALLILWLCIRHQNELSWESYRKREMDLCACLKKEHFYELHSFFTCHYDSFHVMNSRCTESIKHFPHVTHTTNSRGK